MDTANPGVLRDSGKKIDKSMISRAARMGTRIKYV